jgi:non-heme chloroperoxidase
VSSAPLVLDSVELPTGVRLEYVERGDPRGVPLLCLHGLSDSWRSFEPMLPHLPTQVRALALTQRGHGDSDRPLSGYAPGDLAADAVAFLDVLGIERAVVVGHSMGAWVAERIAVSHPARVRGVVLAGAMGPIEDNRAADELVEVIAGLTDPVDPGFVTEFQLSTLAAPLPDGQIDAFVAESLKLPARVWREAVAGFFGLDVYADLAAIAAPALVLWGDRDAFSDRADQDRIVRSLPRARGRVYGGFGHALHWEQPSRFAADVAAFATAAPR